MLMFTLAVSYLTTSNLPWFMDLMFQVPVQYCSLQHQTLLPSPVTSTTGHCFRFGSVSSSFWSYFSTLLQEHIGHLPTWGVHLSLSCLFDFSYYLWSSQGKNTEVVCLCLLQDHVLSELSTVTRLSWVVLHGMAHSFTELDKAVVHVISLISFLWLGAS